ncbi:MAG TPA: N-acetyltransferase family protein [Bacteroidia bacterium]|nr:N-acetyltransferase family protein [Bacteroidia bacterium]
MNTIRKSTLQDLEIITDIYNQAIKSKFETADTIEFNFMDRMDWYNNHPPDTYPVYVYEINGKVVGWISISPYRKGREALRLTVEISYYLDQNYRQQGIGSKLIEYAIQACRQLNYKTLIAIVLDKNEASIKLLSKNGFSRWGHLPNIADFDGEECGHFYFGLRI